MYKFLLGSELEWNIFLRNWFKKFTETASDGHNNERFYNAVIVI